MTVTVTVTVTVTITLTPTHRHGRSLPTPQLCVRIEDLREAEAAAQPCLSVLFIRWGGAHRLG